MISPSSAINKAGDIPNKTKGLPPITGGAIGSIRPQTGILLIPMISKNRPATATTVPFRSKRTFVRAAVHRPPAANQQNDSKINGHAAKGYAPVKSIDQNRRR